MRRHSVVIGCALLFGAQVTDALAQNSNSLPRLAYETVSEQQIVLSWPTSAAGFVMESTAQFSPENQWIVWADPPILESNRYMVRLSAAASAGFYRLRYEGPAVPPDPGSIAPILGPAVVVDLGSATSFLYSGTNAIQTGVTNGTIQAACAAVLRGVVTQSDGLALSGVTISILGHPEYGQTLSRLDGRFDLAVNGGGALAVQCEKSGFLPAQRTVQVPWQDFLEVPEVRMVPVDPVVTPVAFGSNVPLQVVRGSLQADEDGTRQATVLLPEAVRAVSEALDSRRDQGYVTVSLLAGGTPVGQLLARGRASAPNAP
jgi:hypothetical protein